MNKKQYLDLVRSYDYEMTTGHGVDVVGLTMKYRLFGKDENFNNARAWTHLIENDLIRLPIIQVLREKGRRSDLDIVDWVLRSLTVSERELAAHASLNRERMAYRRKILYSQLDIQFNDHEFNAAALIVASKMFSTGGDANEHVDNNDIAWFYTTLSLGESRNWLEFTGIHGMRMVYSREMNSRLIDSVLLSLRGIHEARSQSR